MYIIESQLILHAAEIRLIRFLGPVRLFALVSREQNCKTSAHQASYYNWDGNLCSSVCNLSPSTSFLNTSYVKYYDFL